MAMTRRSYGLVGLLLLALTLPSASDGWANRVKRGPVLINASRPGAGKRWVPPSLRGESIRMRRVKQTDFDNAEIRMQLKKSVAGDEVRIVQGPDARSPATGMFRLLHTVEASRMNRARSVRVDLHGSMATR